VSGGRANFRLLLGAVLASGLAHLWIFADFWSLLGSDLEFLVWPYVGIATWLNGLLPVAVTVPYDPLPHPLVSWVATVVNILVWAGVVYGAAVLPARAWRR
jgi:hypothetical protein